MSLESWKSQYYPTNANEPKEFGEAIRHSLQKWAGMDTAVLIEHGLVRKNLTLLDKATGETFDLTSETCALCRLACECSACPLQESLCAVCDGPGQPYDIFRLTGRTMPMINALKQISPAIVEQMNNQLWDENEK